MKEIICREVAEQEFERFCIAMDLRLKPENHDPKEVETFISQKNVMVEEIMCGHLVISDSGLAVYTPYSTEITQPLTFYEMTFATFEAMDKVKSEENIKRARFLIAEITKQAPVIIYKLNKRDFFVTNAITGIMQGESRPL